MVVVSADAGYAFADAVNVNVNNLLGCPWMLMFQ